MVGGTRVTRQIRSYRLRWKDHAPPLLSWLLASLLIIAVHGSAMAADLPELRVGTLEFGTVDWELQVIRRNKLDESHGFRLVPVRLADKDAASLALLGNAVDVIVSDWLWVSHQRHRGGDLSFVGHSLAVGGVMVPSGSPLHELRDLVGRKVGIAGGPNDKSWLLLRAYAKKTAGLDLAKAVDANFAAPPLLNRLALDGRLDAVLNFWQFDARLRTAGFRELLPVSDILPALGIKRAPPLLGWVFHENWAKRHDGLIRGFLAASFEAKRRLLSSDAEWTALRPLMKAEDDALFIALRDSYRRGIPAGWSNADAESAKRAFTAIVETAGPAVVGGDHALANGTFWAGFTQ
jgi:NitT/TauT family transport system substrate-binding protein